MMAPQKGSFVLRALAVVLAMAAIGCGATGDIDDTEAAAFLVIDRIDQTSDPFGDMLSSGGTILDDTIDVTFSAHLKAATQPPGAPTNPTLQEIVIERYQVEFLRVDGGTNAPPGFQRGMQARVRITPQSETSLEQTTVNLVVVPSTTKAQQPLAFIIDPGFEPGTGFINIQANARITFFGRTLAGDPVSVTGTIGVNFADFGDDNE